MTDRTTQVVIGATLQSSFRTSFRDAVREVDALNRALSNLSARRNNAGLLGIRDAANQVGTSMRRMRTEVSSTARGFQTFERGSTRMGSAMRGLRTDAQDAARGMGSLARSTNNSIGAMRQATNAMREMARATRDQLAAFQRLQAQMGRPLPTPHGGGGGFRGGSRGGGGHGGFGAAGMHGAMHVGFGAVGAGYLAGGLIHKGWEEMAGYAHEVNQRRMQGFSEQQNRQLQIAADRTSSRVGTLSRRELMRMGGDLGFALTDRSHAALALPAVGEAIALMKSSGMKGDVEANAFGFVKGLEQMGRANTETEIARYMKQFTGVTVATGGKVSGTEFLNYVNRSKGAAGFQSEFFLTHVAPTLMQEMGGASAGNAISMLNNALTGGHMSNEARQTLAQMGLLDPADDAGGGGTTGRGRSGWLGRNQPHGTFNKGSADRSQRVKDYVLFQKRPDEWLQKYFAPALRTMLGDGKNAELKADDPRIGQVLARAFSNQSARRAAAIMLTQDNRILKEGNKIDDAIRHATLDVLKNDPEYQLERVGKMWDNLLAAIGQNAGLMSMAGHALSSMGDALDHMAHMDPAQMRNFVTIGAALVGLPTAAFAASTALRFLRTGFGELFALARSPAFIAFAAIGYLIYKNWDWTQGFASTALPGLQKGFDNIGKVFDFVWAAGEKVLHFFGLISDDTDKAADAFDRGAKKGELFGKALEYGLPIIATLLAGRKLLQIADGFYAIAKGIGAAEAAANGGALGALLRSLGLVGGAAAAAAALPAATMNWAEGQNREELKNRMAEQQRKNDAAKGLDSSPEGLKRRFDELLRKKSSFSGDDDARSLFHNAAYTGEESGNRGLLQLAPYGGGGLFTRGGVFDPYGNPGMASGGEFSSDGASGNGGGGSVGGGSGFSGSGGIQGGGRRGFMGGGGGGPTGAGSNGGRHMGDVMRGLETQLIKEGLSPEAAKAGAAALGGSVIQESGGDPTKVHDHGTGYGIYGARLDRRQRMFEWLDKNGFSRDSAEGQARYMAHEAMTGRGFGTVANALRNANGGNLGQVADIVTKRFESPAARSANYQGRINNAYNLYRHGGQNAPGVSDGRLPLAGGIGDGSAVDRARSMLNMGDTAAGRVLGRYMHSGAWCADFVNGVLAKSGQRGTENAMARSFFNWGRHVDMQGAAKGDVLVSKGHVGFATGAAQMHNGRMMIPMISGNHGHKVGEGWADPRQYEVRRGMASVVAAAKAQHRSKPGGGPTMQNHVHAPITIQAQAHHNEEQIAQLAAEHIERASGASRDMRSGMYDWVA